MALQFPSSHSSIPQLNTLVGLYVILHFLLYSSLIHVSSTSTSIISATSPLIIEKGKEALALITWKSSLDIHSQSFSLLGLELHHAIIGLELLATSQEVSLI